METDRANESVSPGEQVVQQTYVEEDVEEEEKEEELEVEEEEEEEEEEEKESTMEDNGHVREEAGHPILDTAATESSSNKSSGKIFIGGLAGETTTEKLTKHFKKYGEIVDSVIMRDRTTGHTRGFGFVTYADPAVVERVMQDKHVLDGKTVEIKRSIPQERMVKGPRTKKIFVGGIPTSVTDDEFQEYFSKFGKVVERQIMHDRESGRSRGFGFITFESEDSVDELLAHGGKLELGGKQVEVKKAEPKRNVSEPGPSARGGHRGADYGGYNEFMAYGGSPYGSHYRPGNVGGLYGSRLAGAYGVSAYGGYQQGGYGGGFGGASLSGGYGSSYDGFGGGYGGILGGYSEYDTYGSLSYGSGTYSSGGYGSGGHTSRYGSSRAPMGRYHPYRRN